MLGAAKGTGTMTNTSDALQQDLCGAYSRLLDRRRRRRRLVRMASLASVGALLLAGAGLGAGALLGWPAPEHVQKEIAAVDQGLPPDLRLNPDVVHARAVASTGKSTMYSATLRGGGHCTEIVTADSRGRGATCTTKSQYSSRAIEVTVPFDEEVSTTSPVVLAGRVNASGASTLELRYADEALDSIPFGEDQFFIFDVPPEHLEIAHSGELVLTARDARGSVVGQETIPADWDDPPAPDTEAPLYVSTRSDESDFTKVYGIEGHVGAPGAAGLELAFSDGERVSIPIQSDGSYEYALPPDRIDDFMEPQTLRALDSDGEAVASTLVAAVAYWRGAER